MLTLTTRAAVEAAVADDSLDPRLRALIEARARQLEDDTEPGVELGDLAYFHVAQPGDGPAEAAAALGIRSDADFAHPPEWVEDRGGWLEAAFVLSDDGFGHVLLVPDRPDTDPWLLALCRDHLTPA